MSAKKEMTKKQRLYYEYTNKEKVKEELKELAIEEIKHYVDTNKSPLYNIRDY
jgi:hypothetical protein